MGWNIDIKSDKPITTALVDRIIAERLPFRLTECSSKQSWGWSLAVDVKLDEDDNKMLCLSGSYSMSGKLAKPAAKAFAQALEYFGHTVTIGEME